MRHLPERNTCHPIPSTVTPSTIIVYVTWCLFSHINLTQYQPEKRGHRIFPREYARRFREKRKEPREIYKRRFFFFFYKDIKKNQVLDFRTAHRRKSDVDTRSSKLDYVGKFGMVIRVAIPVAQILMFATISRSVSLWPSRRCSSSIRLPVNRYRLSFCTAPFVRRVLASVIHHRYGTITIFCRPITRSSPDKGEQKRRRGWWPP